MYLHLFHQRTIIYTRTYWTLVVLPFNLALLIIIFGLSVYFGTVLLLLLPLVFLCSLKKDHDALNLSRLQLLWFAFIFSLLRFCDERVLVVYFSQRYHTMCLTSVHLAVHWWHWYQSNIVLTDEAGIQYLKPSICDWTQKSCWSNFFIFLAFQT